jgi:hypothetical protein
MTREKEELLEASVTKEHDNMMLIECKVMN